MKKPIQSLQENASGFFDKIQNKYQESMTCKAGCSQCCYTDISVFEIEADLIRDWFKALDTATQEKLKNIWSEKVDVKACEFLYDNQCSIYECRPIICRTQGVPIHVSSENLLDFCPLNFKDEPPSKDDWLNLERLNTLLSFAAKSEKRDARIRLKKLKSELMKS